jgi:hypothetical protein
MRFTIYDLRLTRKQTRLDKNIMRFSLNHYTRVLAAIRVLNGLKYGDSKTAIIQLRDFWRSLPQLEDKSGLNQMSEECDGLLKAIQ